MPEWWEHFFDEGYLKAGFGRIRRRKTLADTRFINKVLSLNKGAKILDACCGIGRHAVELAKFGYRVTGVDFNDTYLEVAAQRANKRKVRVRFERYDVRKLPHKNEFDGAICMWTSFGYFEKERDNLKALKTIYRSLKPKGKFLMETINRDWLIANFEQAEWSTVDDGYILERREFDALRSRLVSDWTYVGEQGEHKKHLSLRVYSLHELLDLLTRVGFTISAIFGDRQNKLPTWQHRMNAVLAIK